ncbi:glycosyltransferase [Bacillota bacterium LCP21S3_G6]
MKILIVNKFLYPNGGSETYIFSIGSQLQKMGHEVQYFGMEHEGRIVGNHAESYTEDMSFRSGGSIQGSNVRIIRNISKLTYPFKIIYSRNARRKIRKVLEDFRPDAVHLNNINFQITPSIIEEIKAFDSKIRIVYTAHDPQWVCPNHMMRIPSTGRLCSRCIDGASENCAKNRCIHNSRAQSIIGTMEAEFYKHRKTYKKVDVIIAPSEFMNRTLSHNPQLKGRIVTFHNAVNAMTDEGIDSVGEKKQRYVLYFGRFSEEKGIRTLLKAAEELSEIPFVFAGKGELEDQVNALPNIQNAGFCSGEKMTELIRDAAFTVFPSEWYENCPYSVIESQLAGTPILASDLGGTPELLVPGVTGELFEAGNVEELVDKIRTLWNNAEKRNEYRRGCAALRERKLSLKFDNIEEYCEKLAAIYRGNEW